MFLCPSCGVNTRVVLVRRSNRQRLCKLCKNKFWTKEEVVVDVPRWMKYTDVQLEKLPNVLREKV